VTEPADLAARLERLERSHARLRTAALRELSELRESVAACRREVEREREARHALQNRIAVLIGRLEMRLDELESRP
jgi:FtsZ-binding cell division protein ZapB